MRLLPVFLASSVALACAAPCFAQSLDVASGAPVGVEILRVEAAVEEGVARVEVDETFRNRTDAAQEGVYRFKLPEDAVIGSFSMWMNGQEKHGRVLEARAARRVYDAIVRKKKDPGLLEQVGWREFRVNVFPIPARDTVRVKLVYSYVLHDDLGLETLEVTLPQNCGVVGDLRVHAKVTAAHGLAGVDCPSNADAKIQIDGNCAEATWSGDGVEPRGPFVLRSIPRKDGFDVSVLADRPAGAEDGWFLARVVPRLDAPPKIPRDVVFVVDRSGSMEGKKMDQARAALLAGLATLRTGDRFQVISFSSDVTPLGDGALLDVTPENLDAARRAARDITASGGTNIAGALAAALAGRTADASRFSAVVFLTDGDPTVGETNPDRILATWRATSGATRLFAFGVGNDVHDFLLTKLATEGRGDARYVREDEDLEVKLGSLFDRVRTPLLLDPSVDVEGDGVEVLDREPRRLPDLFQGRPLVVAGRYRGAGKAVLHLRGRSGGADVKIDVPVELPAETPDRPHVAQIWAKARVERLLDDLRTLGASREIRDEVLRLGLRHQLVTPYTSFLVVEDGVRIPDAGESARLPGGDGPAPAGGDVPSAPRSPGAAAGPDAGGPTTGGGGSGGGGGGASTGGGGRSSSGGGSASSGHGGGGLGQGGAYARGGATKQTEAAVMWALRWLKDHQASDGRWSAVDAATGPAADGDVRATGLALLAFVSAGETHQSGTCRDTVKNGLQWLRGRQDADGCFGPRTSPRFLEDHVIAALAATEAYARTHDATLKAAAERGVAFALAARASGGGPFDPEAAGWTAYLLKSAAAAGIDVDPTALDRIVADLETSTDRATGRVAASGGLSDETATAAAVLARILAGRAADDALTAKSVDVLASDLPKWTAAKSGQDPAYVEMATMALFQIGGDRWRRWNDAMKSALPEIQVQDPNGDERGSWDPAGGVGRVETTALDCLSLETYYRLGRVAAPTGGK